MSELFLASKYNRNEFVSFLTQNFLPTDFEQSQTKIVIDKPDTKIKNAIKLGSCPSVGLSVYEFKHTSSHDPRVTLSRESFNIIDKNEIEPNTLAVFFNEDTAQWRLSLITSDYSPGKRKGRVKKEFSNPRRFSYLLGEDCKLHTPESMLYKDYRVKSEDDLVSRFAIEVVTKQFYKELFNWYEWAVEIVKFPINKGGKTCLPKIPDKQANRLHLIRLITRLIFVWFIKQKGLIPSLIFDEEKMAEILKGFDPNSMKSGCYYNAIIQNLFFATLNKPINERNFTNDKNLHKEYGVNTFYRDCLENLYFKITHKEIIERFKPIPFLNGGLFECLDNDDDKGKKEKIYVDGFSREKNRRAFIPNILFWGQKTNNCEQDGIISILNKYNFTVEENTPQEIEVALDPELLGKVFENLLSTYNPETEKTARKESGSFYTPREIITYMADETLIAHLEKNITGLTHEDILLLFHDDTELSNNLLREKEKIETSLLNIKIIDPAVGSASFPMALLNRIVSIMQKMPSKKYQNIYDLKLHLIENCIFGVDIQPIAVQIAKLRFFISLICDQTPNNNPDENYGIIPLPNLETKFVSANTLIGLDEDSKDQFDLRDSELLKMEKELWDIRHHKNIYAATREQKMNLREQDTELCLQIKNYLLKKAVNPDYEKIEKARNKIENLKKEIEKLPEHFVDVADNQLFEDATKLSLFRKDINKEKRDAFLAEIKVLTKEIDRELKKEKLIGLEDRINKMTDWNPYDQNISCPWFDSKWMLGGIDQFDIVIGNPPYIQLQGKLADVYSGTGYVCFSRMGDIYQLFYERGYNLLKEKGHLCFITSNKWMRAAYGEKTRNFFAGKANPKILIDFAGQRVFESATVDVNIILLEKKENEQKTLGCIIKEDCKNNMTGYIKQHSSTLEFLSGNSWVILNPIEKRIKEKIERVGTPLKNWDISINYGIKTGCNEAFIIDKTKRDELIAKDKKSAEIVRPILRGRDIARYQVNFADLYLINTHNGISSKDIPPIDIKEYPAIKEHLDKYLTEIKNRDDQGITPYNLRSCAYMDDFSKQKIIYPNMTKFLPFYLDNHKFYQNDKSFMIVGESIAFLTAFFNSSLFKFCFLDNFPELQGGTRELRKVFFDKIPVINIDSKTNKLFETKILEIQGLKQKNIDTKINEIEIDKMIFDLYELSEKERKIIGFIEIL